jgi:hypothetical protein
MGALCDAPHPPFCALTIFSHGKSFCDVHFRQRAKSLARAIYTLVMDGLWSNFEVEKAFETACISVHIGRAIVMRALMPWQCVDNLR